MRRQSLTREEGMGSRIRIEDFMEVMILNRLSWEMGENLERGETWEGSGVVREL